MVWLTYVETLYVKVPCGAKIVIYYIDINIMKQFFNPLMDEIKNALKNDNNYQF